MLYEIIKHIYPEITDNQFSLQDDGDGPYIKSWYYSQPQPTSEQITSAKADVERKLIANALEAAVDKFIDKVAKSYKYESIRTMVTYSTSDHATFGPEGRAAVKWRDAVYSHCIQVQADVLSGARPVPTEAELIAELPDFAPYITT